MPPRAHSVVYPRGRQKPPVALEGVPLAIYRLIQIACASALALLALIGLVPPLLGYQDVVPTSALIPAILGTACLAPVLSGLIARNGRALTSVELAEVSQHENAQGAIWSKVIRIIFSTVFVVATALAAVIGVIIVMGILKQHPIGFPLAAVFLIFVLVAVTSFYLSAFRKK
jgi:hypothetical protein